MRDPLRTRSSQSSAKAEAGNLFLQNALRTCRTSLDRRTSSTLLMGKAHGARRHRSETSSIRPLHTCQITNL